jgi:hypothetical protein
MTVQEAHQVDHGQQVMYRGQRHTVLSRKLVALPGPETWYFDLEDEDGRRTHGVRYDAIERVADQGPAA